MKRVMPVKANWIYVDAPESQQRLQTAYDRIFILARQSLVKKREMRHISLWMTSKDTYSILDEL